MLLKLKFPECFFLMPISLIFVFSIMTIPAPNNAQAGNSLTVEYKTDVEKMIYSDRELLELDRMMHQSYRNVLQGASRNLRSEIMHDQDVWLKKRRKCEDTDCLKACYEERITDLNNTFLSKTDREYSGSSTSPKKISTGTK